MLEVEQPDRPNFVTVVEAGLLAKASLNSAGLGIAVNALVTSLDCGELGVPFHVLIRAFADCESLSDAIYVATKNTRASSGNYLFTYRRTRCQPRNHARGLPRRHAPTARAGRPHPHQPLPDLPPTGRTTSGTTRWPTA